MFTRVLLPAVLMAGLTGLPEQAQANDIVDFLRDLEQFRERSRNDALQRDRQFQQRYQTARQGDLPPNFDPQSGYSFYDPTIPPGHYQTEMPWGEQRNVFVQPQPNGDAPGRDFYTNEQRNLLQTRSTVRQVISAVDRVHDLADDYNFDQVEDMADNAVDALEDLEDALEDGDRREMQQSFAVFEKTWHPLANALYQSRQLPPALRQATEAAVRADELLHRQLSAPPERHGYNRLQAVALANQMSEYFHDFARNPTWDNRQLSYNMRVSVQRSAQYAHDLAESLRRNAPLNMITNNYREFDRHWNQFVAETRRTNQIELSGWDKAQRIMAIDRQLHQLLEVDGAVDDRDRIASQMRFARQTANRLAAAMSNSRVGNSDIARTARELSSRLDRLDTTYRQFGFRGGEARRAWERSSAMWQQMQRQVQAIGGPRPDGPFAGIYRELQQDMADLQQALADGPTRNRHPHHSFY